MLITYITTQRLITLITLRIRVRINRNEYREILINVPMISVEVQRLSPFDLVMILSTGKDPIHTLPIKKDAAVRQPLKKAYLWYIFVVITLLSPIKGGLICKDLTHHGPNYDVSPKAGGQQSAKLSRLDVATTTALIRLEYPDSSDHLSVPLLDSSIVNITIHTLEVVCNPNKQLLPVVSNSTALGTLTIGALLWMRVAATLRTGHTGAVPG